MGVSETLGVTYFGVLLIRILPFRVLYWGPLFSETPIYTTVMEFCPQNHNRMVFWDPMYVDPLGTLLGMVHEPNGTQNNNKSAQGNT